MNNDESIAQRTDIPPDVASTSNDYAKRFSGDTGKFFLDVQANCVNHFLSPSSPLVSNKIQTILELGGGHCQLLDTYFSLGYQITIQGSDERSFTRPTELGYQDRVSYLTHSIYELESIPDNSYDIVSGIRLMAHIEDWGNYLKQCLRIAKHGIIFDYANLYSINILSPILFKLKKRIEKNTRPFFCQRGPQVDRKLRELGAKEIEKYPQFIFPMGLHRAMKCKEKSEKIEKIARGCGLTIFGSPVMVYAKKF